MKKGLVVLMLLTMLLTGCRQETIPAPELLKPSGVHSKTVAAYRGEIYQIDRYDASVKPYAEALYFEAAGTVGQVYAHAGEYVEAGEVLMELNQSALERRLEQLQGEMEYQKRENAYQDALMELDVELLEIELRQLQALRANEIEMALKQNEIAAKKAELRQMRALREPEQNAKTQELERLIAQMEQGVLKASISGRIAFMKELPQGEMVKAYETLLYIADEHRLVLESQTVSELMISSADFLYAHIGAQYYPVRLIPTDAQEYMLATLKGNKPAVRFELLEGGQAEAWQAGQYASIYVVRDYVPDALLLPSQAVLGEADGRYVYVEENGERVRRMIQTGIITDAQIQVLDGLQEGEMVYVQE